jgi:nitrile hydratase subunit beta
MTDLADKDVPRAMHDLGGVARYMCEPIDTEPHELTDFDREVDAIRQILGVKAVMSTDELRRGIEALPEEEYLRLSYYERWLRAITAILILKGMIDEAELKAAVAAAP